MQRGMKAGDEEESAIHKQGRANGDITKGMERPRTQPETCSSTRLLAGSSASALRATFGLGKFTSTLTSSSCSGLTFCPSSLT